MENRPRLSYGIHNITVMDISTGLPKGILKVVSSLSGGGERETNDLFAGSNPNAWDSEVGNVNNDLTMNIKEFHPCLFELAGYNKTLIQAAVDGEVVDFDNKFGTSVKKATTGIASVAVKEAKKDNLKDGLYVIKATAAAKIEVYAVTDIDFEEGAETSFLDANGKILAETTVVTGASVNIADFGLTITGGSGTIAFDIGDTAMFEVRRAHKGGYIYSYGINPVPLEFSAYATSQKRANGEFVRIFYPRLKLTNFPTSLNEKEWSGSDITVKVISDPVTKTIKSITDIVK